MADRRGLSLKFDILFGDAVKVMDDHKKDLATASSLTMDNVLTDVKVQGRADIAAAGFSKRWQNALRTQRYPKSPKTSIDASGQVWHQIQYAGVFEEGAVIHGSPLLWLPFSTTASKVGGRKMTPARFEKEVAPLTSLKSRNGTPILAAPARLSGARAAATAPKVSLATLRKGAASKTDNGRARKGVVRLIPIFHGVSTVDIPKKISIYEVCQRAAGKIPGLHAKNLASTLAD